MSSHVTFYYFSTPNGKAPAILFEELKEAYGDNAPSVEVQTVSFGDGENGVKSEWFLKINPNGRMPAISHDGNDVFETSAINEYLAQVFDKDHKLSFDPQTNLKEWSEQQSWTYFAHGGIGPMFGQIGFFYRASEDIPFAKKRYVDESKRLLSVLELHFSRTGNEYLAGNRYSIADIKAFPWVEIAAPGGRLQEYLGENVFNDFEDYPHVLDWVKRISERPAVKRGLAY